MENKVMVKIDDPRLAYMQVYSNKGWQYKLALINDAMGYKFGIVYEPNNSHKAMIYDIASGVWLTPNKPVRLEKEELQLVLNPILSNWIHGRRNYVIDFFQMQLKKASYYCGPRKSVKFLANPFSDRANNLIHQFYGENTVGDKKIRCKLTGFIPMEGKA